MCVSLGIPQKIVGGMQCERRNNESDEWLKAVWLGEKHLFTELVVKSKGPLGDKSCQSKAAQLVPILRS